MCMFRYLSLRSRGGVVSCQFVKADKDLLNETQDMNVQTIDNALLQ